MEQIFTLPVKEHPYMPQGEMWLLPPDLSDEFTRWQSLSRWQRFWLMSRFRRALRDGRAGILKLDLEAEE